MATNIITTKCSVCSSRTLRRFVRARTSKATEFGKLVKIEEAKISLWSKARYTSGGPTIEAWRFSLGAHQLIFGRPPCLIDVDEALVPCQQARCQQRRHQRVCMRAVGKPSAEQRAEQHQRWFRRDQRVRAGYESRISVMKRRDGLARCPLSRPRWNATLGRLGSRVQQPVGSITAKHSTRKPPSRTRRHMKIRSISFAPQIS